MKVVSMVAGPRALLLTALLACAPPRAPACLIDWVTVEANEGGASGGHAAIRFGQETYHFQHHRPGMLRLQRDEWSHFLFVYGVLKNRRLELRRIAAEDETCALLRDHFSARRVIEDKQLEVLDELAADRELLEWLLAHRRAAEGGPALRGAGFFSPAPPASSAAAPALIALRERVAETEGRGFLRSRIEALQESLGRLRPETDLRDVPLEEGRYPVLETSIARKYRELATALLALRFLDEARPLQAGTFYEPAGDDFALDAAEARVLGRAAARLEDSLARLVASPRPDFGFPLLVGMARLLAVQASLESGRLVFLDAYAPRHEVIERRILDRHREILPALLTDAREDLRRARARLVESDAVDEIALGELEGASNRLLAVRRAAFERADLPLQAAPLVPSLEAPATNVPLPVLGEDELRKAVDRARAREASYAERLRRLYGYDLIARNCVTELFRTMNAAIASAAGNAAAVVEAESTARLGGFIDSASPVSVVPFIAAQAVQSRFAVVALEKIPSYRQTRLEALVEHEPRLVVALRESNVLTSTLYRGSVDDSVFLFFTDELPAARPILGALNLVTGVGAVVAGVALAGFDGGRLVSAGWRGALFSLPELAFVSLRKGSFDYVGHEARAAYARRVGER